MKTPVETLTILMSNQIPVTTLDDVAFKEGNEHTRQITGSPLASMMFVENPKAFAEVVCLAPAEGQQPLSIITDSTIEAMSNPNKYLLVMDALCKKTIQTNLSEIF